MQIRSFTVASVLVGIAAVAGPARAAQLDYSVILRADGQNMWGSGSSSLLDKQYFYGSSWDKSSSSGGFDSGCVNLGVGEVCSGRNGVQVTGTSEGRAGLLFSLEQDSGTVNAGAPGTAKLTLSDNPQPGHDFTVTSEFTMGKASYLTTSFANASLSGNLILDAHAEISGESCVFGSCSSASTGDLINIDDQDISLFSYNHNGDNKLKAFGVAVPVFQFGHTVNLPLIGSKLGDIRINNPNLTLSGHRDTKEIDGDCIHYIGPTCIIREHSEIEGRSAEGSVPNVLSVHADILNMVLQYLGTTLSTSVEIPGCPLPFCSVGLDIGEINVGPTLGIAQSFFLKDPTFFDSTIKLHIQETGQDIEMGADMEKTILFPSEYSALHIVPTFINKATLYNDTYLTVAPDINFNFLKACMLGECVGPLYQYCPTSESGSNCTIPRDSDTLQIPIFSKELQITMSAVGEEFVIGNPDADRIAATPEPGSWMLAAIGIALIGMKRVLPK